MLLLVLVNGRKGALMSSINNHFSNTEGYNRWSSIYDQYPNLTVAIDELTFPKLWEHLHNKHILEIGCGTGRHTQKLVAARNHVTGIDISNGMLSVAQMKLTGMPVTLIEADFMTYDLLKSNTFDAIISSLVVEHVKNLEHFYHRVANVLKVDGEVFISEIHPSRALNGSLAHFNDPESNECVYLDSTAHSQNRMEEAANHASLKLIQKIDVLKNDDLIALDPKWSKYKDRPIIQIWYFKK